MRVEMLARLTKMVKGELAALQGELALVGVNSEALCQDNIILESEVAHLKV